MLRFNCDVVNNSEEVNSDKVSNNNRGLFG